MEDIYNYRAALWARLSNDPDAFDQLFREYWPQVYTTCLHFCKCSSLSKDLTQEIFLKIWTRRQKFGLVEKPDAFLCTIVKNALVDHIRSQKVKKLSMNRLNDLLSSSATDPLKDLECKELGLELTRAINVLPPQLRQVLTLGRINGMTHVEIAKKQCITTSTSKTYMTRALVMLRKNLEK